MKKVSTGERVSIADLRRGVTRLLHTQNDSEIAGEQMFVSELMDVTPSSSYEETGDWRDGYIYQKPGDTSPRSANGASDDNYPQEVVTDDQIHEVEGLFVKEDVPSIQSTQGSLLARELESIRLVGPQAPRSLGTPASRGGTNVGGSSGGSSAKGSYNADSQLDQAHSRTGSADLDPAECSNGSARHLIRSLLQECERLTLNVERLATQCPELYELRIVDDDGEPDLDFPELDSSAAVVDVGVDQFALCPVGHSDVILRVHVKLQHGSANEVKQPAGEVCSLPQARLEVDFYPPVDRDCRLHLTMPLG